MDRKKKKKKKKKANDYHLEPLLHRSSTLQIGSRRGDVVVDGLLRKVDHVTGKEGLSMDLEVGLVSIEHAVEPRKQLLSTVVRVKNHGNAVDGGDAPDVVSTSRRTSNRSLLAIIAHALELTSQSLHSTWTS